ncbi:MAG TPA: DNA polymerase IV [Kiritimatiellia bacterium]
MIASFEPFTMAVYPTAVVHLDGDAFFTSIEQAVHSELRGRPVVTGKERGIIACASYEAKKLGVKRGIRLQDAEKMCPGLVVLPSDYETYSLYSKRMFNIMRRFTPMVEESSIDEGFAEITGVRRLFHTSYEEIAKTIKDTIHAELDITVSVGLSLTKGLAKMASKFRKPDGFTGVSGNNIHLFLQRHGLDDVWGFGPNTTKLLEKQGLKTAYDFAARPEKWAENLLGKIGREIWNELRGNVVYPVNTEEKSTYATISKCKTFTAPSADRDFVYAKLVRNVESAFIKLRRYKLKARLVIVALRRRDFSQVAMEAKLNRHTSSTQEVLPVIKDLFDRLFIDGTEYRTTVVLFGNIEEDRSDQFELFEDRLRIDKMSAVSRAIDEINERFGKHKVCLGPSLYLDRGKKNSRDVPPERKRDLLPGETKRRRLGVPKLDVSV